MPDAVQSDWGASVSVPFSLANKPRRCGVTMVIDKGLGPMSYQDLLMIGAPVIDFIKLGFGTSLLYPPRVLAEKIAVAKDYGVTLYPGGTLLEVAELQGSAEHFLDQARQLGFDMIEVSEGTIGLTATRRNDLIIAARERGLRVISEVGKKTKGSTLDPSYVQAQVAADLAAGAEYVILEGRDSGKAVGVYNDEGKMNESLVQSIYSAVPDPNVLIWEAPQVSQQQQLIIMLGRDVNLGNVQPDDVISLAATRAGVRGDTFRLVVESAKCDML